MHHFSAFPFFIFITCQLSVQVLFLQFQLSPLPPPPTHTRAQLTYFTDRVGGGGVQGIFWSLKFWPKGIFWVYKDAGITWATKKTGKFLGGCQTKQQTVCCTFHQLKSTKTKDQFTVGVGFFGVC